MPGLGKLTGNIIKCYRRFGFRVRKHRNLFIKNPQDGTENSNRKPSTNY